MKVETDAHGMYKLDIGHEFHCMQTPTYNHKVEILIEALVLVCQVSWCNSHTEGLKQSNDQDAFFGSVFFYSSCFFAFYVDKDSQSSNLLLFFCSPLQL